MIIIIRYDKVKGYWIIIVSVDYHRKKNRRNREGGEKGGGRHELGTGAEFKVAILAFTNTILIRKLVLMSTRV